MPGSSIWAAVTTEAAKRKTLTEVIHTGKGEICIGKSSSPINIHETDLQASEPEAIISFIEALAAAGFHASLSKEVDTIIYRKLLINAVINPLTAIWRVRNGELLASAARVQLMKELYTEAAGILEACGISLSTRSGTPFLKCAARLRAIHHRCWLMCLLQGKRKFAGLMEVL